jgi:RNA polymerase primary sigma factor
MRLLCNGVQTCRIFEITGGRVPPDRKAEQLGQLLRTGRTRGYVLYEEIDKILAPGRDGLAELDTILSELTMNHIEVIDEPRTEDSVPDESFFDQKDLEEDFCDSKPLRLYLREVLMVPRLTIEEEKELAKRVKDASSVERLTKGPVWPEEAEKRLIEANLWIALGTAMHFLNRGLGPLELIQEGNIGLMRAVTEYNHLRAYRFSTYATWWVRRAIIQSLRDYNLKQTE